MVKSEHIDDYLSEIKDAEWVVEVISERFDNAPEMMTPGSIMYGGAVRDALAGLDLLGDLDFAVDRAEFSTISKNFNVNSRWIPIDDDDATGKLKAAPAEPSPTPPVSSSSKIARELSPMSNLSIFRTINGNEVQLITSKKTGKSPIDNALYVARMVDIICCGVVVTHDGRVFEVVKGAYADCKNRVLRLNKNSDTLFTGTLSSRVNKLVERGWKNTIDIEKEVKRIEADRAKRRKDMAAEGLICKDKSLISRIEVRTTFDPTKVFKGKPDKSSVDAPKVKAKRAGFNFVVGRHNIQDKQPSRLSQYGAKIPVANVRVIYGSNSSFVETAKMISAEYGTTIECREEGYDNFSISILGPDRNSVRETFRRLSGSAGSHKGLVVNNSYSKTGRLRSSERVHQSGPRIRVKPDSRPDGNAYWNDLWQPTRRPERNYNKIRAKAGHENFFDYLPAEDHEVGVKEKRMPARFGEIREGKGENID